MKIIVTAREILDRGDWDAFCELKGYNPWCMNEGLMDSSEEFTLTVEELRQIGMSVPN